MKKQYAIIGDSVRHSLSPAIYNTIFDYYGINAGFVSIRVKRSELRYIKDIIKTNSLSGFTCTMPHKREIIRYLDWISVNASEIGSVNVVINQDDALIGYNTDGGGMLGAIMSTGYCVKDIRAVILGAGGAARAAAYALAAVANSVSIVARRHEQAHRLSTLIESWGCRSEAYGWRDMSSACKNAGLFINATPIGMEGQSDFDDEAALGMLNKNALVLDMVYKPRETLLVRLAREIGLRCENGLGMLLEQAYGAFRIWTGISACDECREAVKCVLETVQ